MLADSQVVGTVEQTYAERIVRYGALRATASARWSSVANWRLMIAVAALVAAGAGWWWAFPLLLWFAGAMAVAFLALVLYHNRLAARRDHFDALYAQNREGLLRLERNWAQLPLRQPAPAAGDAHTATQSVHHEEHLAHDLDLLGAESLQHLLGTARSPAGLSTLQAWLLRPAPPATVADRQAAVRELAPHLDTRDELTYLAGRAGEAEGAYQRFVTWAEGAPWLLRQPVLLWLCRISPLLLLAGLGAQLGGLTPLPLWGPFLLLNMLLTTLYGWRAQETLVQLYDRADLLRAYADLFRLAASMPVQAAALQRMQEVLGNGPARADRRLGRLSLIAATAELSRSLLFPVLQFGLLWSFHVVALAERWRVTTGRRVGPWLNALGELEALCAFAALAHDHPAWSFPTINDDEPPRVTARGLGHPLLRPTSCVTNDVVLGPPGRMLLITGSNMSGKSTLLRAIGVNLCLAQAGAPVCASDLLMPPLALATSMRVQDSLAQGVSYFMAELRRLKQIVDLAEAAQAAGGPLVCVLLDEILHGTNSAERLVAAARVVRHLIDLQALGAVSTHDLALAQEPQLAEAAELAHFSEHFVEGPAGLEMRFDYVLHQGLATTTNALRLMEMVGL